MRLSAPRPTSASPGAAHTGKALHTIIAIADILAGPNRLPNSVEVIGGYSLKPNAKTHEFYGTPSTQDGSYESSGTEDAISILHKYVVEHPGDEIASQSFAQEWMGVPCIVIRDFCDGSLPTHYGTLCAPVYLQPSFTANSEKTAFTFTFQAFAPTTLLPGRGLYNKVDTAPFAVADNEALALSVANGYRYLLKSDADGDSIAVSTNTLPHNSLVTLIGQGGADPSTLAASSGVLLNEGATWTALEGSTLTLRVFDNGPSKVLIEQTRS